MLGWDEIWKLIAAAILLAIAVGCIWPRRAIELYWRVRRTLAKGFASLAAKLASGPRPSRRSPPSTSRSSFTLKRFWVVDGDTIRDLVTKTTYRLENIDSPETDERAKCPRERERGERAKFEAVRLLKGAQVVIVRPTGKIDRYGRSIAFIEVDGQDFGGLMIDRGFARPWRGVREDWCGPNGGLAKMAEACSAKFHCKTCGGRANVAAPDVVTYPEVFPKPAEPSQT